MNTIIENTTLEKIEQGDRPGDRRGGKAPFGGAVTVRTAEKGRQLPAGGAGREAGAAMRAGYWEETGPYGCKAAVSCR